MIAYGSVEWPEARRVRYQLLVMQWLRLLRRSLKSL